MVPPPGGTPGNAQEPSVEPAHHRRIVSLGGGEVATEDDFELPKDFRAFEKLYKKETPLIAALRGGLSEGADMEDALDEVDHDNIEAVEEAAAVLAAYQQLCRDDDDRAKHVAELFRFPGSKDVFSIFYHFGMPVVHERLQAVFGRETGDTDLSNEEYQALAVLSGYGYAPAFDDILAASKDPRLHESWMWVKIFDAGNPNDEDYLDLLKRAGIDLPTGFACVAFLDRCNELCLEHDFDPQLPSAAFSAYSQAWCMWNLPR